MFRLVFSIVCLVLLVTGYVMLKIYQKKRNIGADDDESLNEYQKERERREKEAKELDDYLKIQNADYTE